MNKIIQGECAQVMEEFSDEFIDLVNCLYCGIISLLSKDKASGGFSFRSPKVLKALALLSSNPTAED